ncbi:MAG: UDP-3-O-acyl-N-acetylglucosamine deacetylase [Thermodesulfobacteriaceae bacterium]|nr:UDP-3-O-acyl-N-acetylglucosamine deacetylase [Thermodesulfobacteriaceae bacterium]MCX8041648.1 UDP-3-O-acyl-N-acetylglucosamine deacetylase [Thermodesulfobacteriaceae bacterium]MDW8136079.1 UDP-3-O-acyl-N-acetylglucosamine deacetylase [Thermodesulfobacterium sp.]
MEYQRTIGDKIIIEGEGVFSGKWIRVELEPTEKSCGILFIREDLPHKPVIPLSIENTIGLEGLTLITDGEHFIYLVEHLLSALHALQIDNLIVRVFGEEIPLLDGSAYPWVRKVQEVGYKFLLVPKIKYKVTKRFSFENGESKIIFEPSNILKIRAEIYFNHPLIGSQSFEIEINPWNYIREISFARTFGFKEILLERKNKGILKGGNLSNALILDETKVLNPEGLRAKDEFVRHKVLDLIGDLFSGGKAFLGEVKATFSNHRLHINALKNLFSTNCLEKIESRALTFFFLPKRLKKRF